MVILVVLVTVLVASLSGGLVLLGGAERRIAASHRDTMQLLYIADGAADLAIAELAGMANWTTVPGGPATSAMSSGARQMAVTPTTLVDLDARTVDLNAEAARRTPLGPNTPRWRLFSWGPLGVGPRAAGRPACVAVWVSDDATDGDGDAGTDSNGVLVLRAEAFGVGELRRAVELTVRRSGSRIGVLAWREAR